MTRKPEPDDPRAAVYSALYGSGIGFGGILLVYGAEYLLGDSLTAELMAATGLLLIACGIFLMLRGYLKIILQRLLGGPHDRDS